MIQLTMIKDQSKINRNMHVQKGFLRNPIQSASIHTLDIGCSAHMKSTTSCAQRGTCDLSNLPRTETSGSFFDLLF